MSRIGRLLLAVALGVLAVAFVPAGPASAHGNITSPASRNYGCWERWGSRFQDPVMATQDPMCWQAWQADTNAMWNWNGLYREGAAGNHQGVIPDGQLCSAGQTSSGRYNAMDAVGNWTAASVANNFNVRLFDQAGHGADYVRVYLTKASYNPLTQPLKWSDLELVSQIGNKPASQWTPVTGGQVVDLPVSASGRTGRAMTYTIWQASHSDQSYYFCSDISFGGTGTPPTDPTDPPSEEPTDPPSTPPSTGACTATYSVTSAWQGAYQTEVTVMAGSAAIRNWTVTLNYPGAQTIQQGWNAVVSASGSTVTASNMSYNGTLAAAHGTSFGFIGGGASTTPTVSCSATTA